MTLQQDMMTALNRVCKWRNVLTGRIVGTQPKTPAIKGVSDIFENLIILRAETTALTGLLIKKGVITEQEYMRAVLEEAELLDMDYAKQFPGIRALDDGLKFYDLQKARETMKGWLA